MAHTPAGQEYSYNEDLKENHTVQPNGVVDLNTVGLMKGGADPLLLNYDLVSSLQQSVANLKETLDFTLTQLTIQRQDMNLLETNVAKIESIQILLESAIKQMAPWVDTVQVYDGVSVNVPFSFTPQYNENSLGTLAHSSQYSGGLTQTQVSDDYEASNPNTTSHQSATLEFIQSIVNEWLNANQVPD